MHLNFTALIDQSPQAHILEELNKESHSYKVQISDLLRLLLLSKHGGAYMDSDTVSLKPFPSDIANFVIEGKPTNFH